MSSSYFKPLFKLGIRQKVILVLLTVALIALTSSAWLTFKTAKAESFKAVSQRGDDISRFVATSLSFSVVGYDYHTIQLLLDEITTFEEINYAKVINIRGNTMGVAGEATTLDDEVVFKKEVKLGDNLVAHLEIGFSTVNTIKKLDKQKYILLKREALLILLIAIGEFIALSIIIIRPVRIISKVLDNAVDDKGTIIKKINISTSDEFGQLSRIFNQLGDQLNSANTILKSKIDLADENLIETNKKLVEQTEELKNVRDKFHELSITDSLTQLFNRRYFEDLLESEVKIMKRYGDINSILLLDIDFFKKVNDQYGHSAGDQVLKKISQLILKSVRLGDVVCRVGGEEFVVFCRRIEKNDAKELAEKIRENISGAVIKVDGEAIATTVSIGVSTYYQNESDHEPGSMFLYRKADIAMYHSKENGRNKVTHYDDI